MTTTTPSTLLGPLTTTYTPTGSLCNSLHYAKNSNGAGWFALGGIGIDSTSCMPTGFTRDPEYYFSPGICPSGYVAACSSSFTSDSSVITVGTCCPQNYVCRTPRAGNIYGCTSLVTDYTVLTLDSVTFETISTASTTIYTNSQGVITTTLSSDQTYIEAYGVIVQRQSTDASFIAASTSTSTSGATAATASGTSSSQSTISNQETSSASGLSTGAKVGIGLGVAAGVIAILIAMFFLFARRKKNNKNNINANNYNNPGYAGGNNEMQYHGGGGAQWAGQPTEYSEVGGGASPQHHQAYTPHSQSQYTDQTYFSSSTGGVVNKGNYEPLHELSTIKSPVEMEHYARVHEMQADPITR